MKFIHSILKMPIRRKLTLLLLTPCVVVLLLAGAGLFGFQIRMFRKDFARDMSAVADIVGANCTAAIAFNDPKAASEILDSLKAKDAIVSAILILPEGTIFARYGLHPGVPVIETGPRFVFRDDDALMIEPVMLDGKQVATLNVVSDYRSVYASLLKLVGWGLLVVVVLGTGVALLLSNWLQRFISDPVLRLARTAQTVADQKNYSVRAQEEPDGELGVLTRTFNQMLARIQEQDEAITRSQHKLDALIHSIEGIVWECTPDTFHFTFVSRQSERILGYPPEQWMADPSFWHNHLHPEDAATAIQTCRDCATAGQPYSYEYRMLAADGRTVWIRESGSVLVEDGRAVAMRGIFLDITERKEAEEQMEKLNKQLRDTSRAAGMAEVATGVLHNVGNVLNSVNVSTTLASDLVRKSKVSSLGKAQQLLRAHAADLGTFLTTDPKGKLLPGYLQDLATHLVNEQAAVLKELNLLTENVGHIKDIVAMQQNYAKVSGVVEPLPVASLLEDAVRMNAAAFLRHGVTVVREYQEVPNVEVDKHKVLQILMNLLRNAKYAMDESPVPEKVLTLRIARGVNGQVQVSVADNGVGIPPENLTRIFQHGFTTRRDGHGFGLHSGSLAAKELGGSLTVHSEGPGLGATFILGLPAAAPAVQSTGPTSTPSGNTALRRAA